MGKVHLKTKEAVVLWKHEVTGQISDGAWENARPLEHWKFWCDAEVIMDGSIGHEGYPMKSNYNLNTLIRNKVVRERMEMLIRFTRSRFFNHDTEQFASILTSKYYCCDHPEACYCFKTLDVDEEIKSKMKYVEERKQNIITQAVKQLKTVSFVECAFIDKEKLFELMVDSTVKSITDWTVNANERYSKMAKILEDNHVTKDNLKDVFNEISAIPVDRKDVQKALDEISVMLNSRF